VLRSYFSVGVKRANNHRHERCSLLFVPFVLFVVTLDSLGVVQIWSHLLLFRTYRRITASFVGARYVPH
jgi:hypothetical protein